MLAENQQLKRNSTKTERVLSPHVSRLATADKSGLSKKRFLSKKQLYMFFIEKKSFFVFYVFFYFSATHRTYASQNEAIHSS